MKFTVHKCFLHFVGQILKMTTAQVVETPVTVNNNSLIQDYVHPDDQTQPTFKYCMLRKDIWLVVNKILGKKPKTYST